MASSIFVFFSIFCVFAFVLVIGFIFVFVSAFRRFAFRIFGILESPLRGLQSLRFAWTDETARARSERYFNSYPPISRDLVVDISLALKNVRF